MASIFGGSLRLALKQSLAETGHLAAPSKPSKKNRSKKHKRSEAEKKRLPPPPSSSDEDIDESEENDSSSSSLQDERSLSSAEQELDDSINDNITINSHNYETRDGSKRRSTLKKKRKRSKGIGTKKASKATIPPPSPDILSWVRNMPESHQKLSIAIGMRVKVRFDTGRRKKDRSGVSRRYLWYGGSVSDVLRNGKRVRIVYDDGTKEVSSFPDNDIVVDDKDNGTHQVSADAFIPQSTDEDNFSDDSSEMSDKSEVRDEHNENDSKNDDDEFEENVNVAKDKSLPNINPIAISSPPSNKVSTVTESSFSHPSSSSAGNNDSCESSYSDCTNDYQFPGKSHRSPPVVPSNVSAPRITLSTSQKFQQNSLKETTEQDKSREEQEKNIRSKTTPSLTIKLIPPKKSLQVENRNDKDHQSIDYSSSSSEENCSPVPKSLRISVVRTEKASRSTKRRIRQRQTVYENENVDTVPLKSYFTGQDSDTSHEIKKAEGHYEEKSKKINLKFLNNQSINHSKESDLNSSDEDSIADHELENNNRINSEFGRNTSPSLFVDSDGKELSSDDNSGSLTSDNNDNMINFCDQDEQDSCQNASSDGSKGLSLSTGPSAKSRTPVETASKKNITSPSQSPSASQSDESDTNSTQMNDTDNEQISASSKNKAQRSSRSGRRAAQKANERIVAKENILVDEYAAPRKRRERINLDLFPLPENTEQTNKTKRIKSLNRQSIKTTDVEKDPWVQCDRCHKWRHLPPSVRMDELPERWYCEFNSYDLLRNTCDAVEQSLEDVVMEKVLINKKNDKSNAEIKSENKNMRLNLGKRATLVANENFNSENDMTRTQSPSALNQDIPSNICVETRAKETSKMYPKKRARHEGGLIKPSSNTKESFVNRNNSETNIKCEDAVQNPAKLSLGVAVNEEIRQSLSPKRTTSNQGKCPKSAKKQDNQEWVQCDKCKKWRTLPPRVSASDLPDTWYCELNTWDTRYASCGIDEVIIEPNARENLISNGTASQMVSSDSPDKLSYRDLIFGTGRKLYRPTSERARAADSLFAYYENEEETSNYPKFMYAESSAFCAKPSRNYECFKHMSILDTMKTTATWNELYGVNNSSPLIQKDSFGEGTILNVKFRRKDGNLIKDFSECDAFYKDLIIRALSTKILGIHEILYELSSLECAISFDEVLRDLHILYLDDFIEVVQNTETNVNNPSPSLPASLDNVADSTNSRLIKYKKPWKCRSLDDPVSAEVSIFHTS